MCIYDIYGPCSFPHGTCYTLLAQCFALGSFVFSTLALTSCFYVSVRPIPVEGEIELPKEGFGWLTRQVKVAEPPSYGKQCVYYDPEEREAYFGGDAMWNSGYAMAVISVTLGVITMCVLFTTCCIAYKMPTFDGLFYTCMICFIAQALTFLSWGSDLCQGETEIPMECTWSSGTGMNLTAAMMWVWAANMIKSFPEALPPRKRKQRSPEDENDDDGYDDDDGGAGDVYMPNRHNNNGNDEDVDYYDEYNQQGGEGEGDGEEEGYYDEDGNWIENQYNDAYNDNGYGDEQQPDGYDNYEGDYNDSNTTDNDGGGGYSDYENEDSSQDWAEGGGGGGTTTNEKEDDSNYGSDDDDYDDDAEESSQIQQQ